MVKVTMKIRIIFIFLLLPICFSACAGVKVDQGVIGQCFELVQDSFLYTYDSCGPSHKSACYGIQSYGVATNDLAKKYIPESKNVLEANEKHWNKMIKSGASFQSSGAGRYVGTVEKGTRIKILHMHSSWSTWRIWETSAQIISGLFDGAIVALPADRYLLGPAWIKGYPAPGKANNPTFDEMTLTVCM